MTCNAILFADIKSCLVIDILNPVESRGNHHHWSIAGTALHTVQIGNEWQYRANSYGRARIPYKVSVKMAAKFTFTNFIGIYGRHVASFMAFPCPCCFSMPNSNPNSAVSMTMKKFNFVSLMMMSHVAVNKSSLCYQNQGFGQLDSFKSREVPSRRLYKLVYVLRNLFLVLGMAHILYFCVFECICVCISVGLSIFTALKIKRQKKNLTNHLTDTESRGYTENTKWSVLFHYCINL